MRCGQVRQQGGRSAVESTPDDAVGGREGQSFYNLYGWTGRIGTNGRVLSRFWSQQGLDRGEENDFARRIAKFLNRAIIANTKLGFVNLWSLTS